VGNHLHDTPGNTQIVEDKEAQRDKTHVRYRRISHQLFHVFLHHGDQADVDDSRQRQTNHQTCPLMRSVWRNRQRETQETIGAKF